MIVVGSGLVLECVGGPLDGESRLARGQILTFFNSKTQVIHHYRQALCMMTGKRWWQYDGCERRGGPGEKKSD